MLKSSLLPIFLFLLLTLPAFGQDPEKTTAEQLQRDSKLAEQLLADADALKLPENRAVVFAEVGGFLCKTDPKRAHTLFYKSVSDLIVAQQQATEIRRNADAFEQLIYGQIPRLQILNTVAGCDAELAIELLKTSRPAKISQLMVRESGNNKSTREYYVSSEVAEEQQFISLAADQSPARAIELLRESLKSGVSYQTISLLQKILQKDEKAAGELTEQAVQKLMETKLTVNDYQATSTFQYFLTEFGREKSPDVKSLTVSESSLRNLTNKISAFWAENGNYNFGADGLKLIEKYFPARAARIEKSLGQNDQQQEFERYHKLVSSDASAEELLKQAEGFKSYRTSVYITAARKLGESGSLDKAVSIINSQFSEQESEAQLSELYYNLASQEMTQGNFEDANRLIDQIPSDQTRFNALLEMARSIYQKNGEDGKQSALSVLNRAQAFIDAVDLTQPEISDLIRLSDAYSTIEPAQAFRILEMTIPRLNDFLRAYAVVSQFRNEALQRNGEFLVTSDEYLSGTYGLGSVLQTLEGRDFDRTMQLVNSFERAETRAALKLELITGDSKSEFDLEN